MFPTPGPLSSEALGEQRLRSTEISGRYAPTPLPTSLDTLSHMLSTRTQTHTCKFMEHVSILMYVLRQKCARRQLATSIPCQVTHDTGVLKKQNNTSTTLKQRLTLARKTLRKPSEIYIKTEKTVAHWSYMLTVKALFIVYE